MKTPRKFKPVRKITIDVRKWDRGSGFSSGLLLNGDSGKMCCLGFYAIARGLKPREIDGSGMPSDVAVGIANNIIFPGLVDEDTDDNTPECEELAKFNDDASIKDTTRMRRIIKGFKRIGVNVKFTHLPRG